MTDDEIAAIDPGNTPAGDEVTLLLTFLDFYRAVMERKLQGLNREQAAVRLGPSTLTLGGLVKHLARVEDSWFQRRLRGVDTEVPWPPAAWEDDLDYEFKTAVDDEPEDLIAIYRAACERSRVSVAAVGDLEAMTVQPNRRGEHFSLRWVLLHMIEETARHAGHADLLRESIDGATGD